MWTGIPGSSVSLYSTAGPVTGPDFCRALPDSQNLPATTLSVTAWASDRETSVFYTVTSRSSDRGGCNSKSCIVLDLPLLVPGDSVRISGGIELVIY